jgi:hypothetical protein
MKIIHPAYLDKYNFLVVSNYRYLKEIQFFGYYNKIMISKDDDNTTGVWHIKYKNNE